MKRYLAILSVFILIFSFSITVFSFNIDGKDKGTEWENAESIILLSSGESNSNVSFGLMKWVVEDNSLFICFNFLDDKLENNQAPVGVSFSVEDSEFFDVVNNESAFYDSEKYRVEGSVSVDITMGVVCEVRIGFKHGISSNINGKVRFIDSQDAYSNIYDFYIENKEDYYFEYEPVIIDKVTTKEEKTTKESTTKSIKTTKATTTKKSDNSVLDLLDLFIYDETTSKVTEEKTTQKETSKTTKRTHNRVVTKIIEKEIYITDKQIISSSENIDISQVAQPTYSKNDKLKTSSGKKYQMLTAIAGGVMLITVAVLGTLGANKKANKDNSKK